MMHPATGVAYIFVEPEDLLRLCIEQLGSTKDPEELTLRGTIPRDDLAEMHELGIVQDPKALGHRFSAKKRIYLDSWSELFTLGSLAHFYNCLNYESVRWVAAVGIEIAYKESALREEYLGDGAIGSSELAARQIVQTCMAQNIRGASAQNTLQTETILRLQDKLSKPPKGPIRILAVTLLTKTDEFHALDFERIALETVGKKEFQDAYGPVFCVCPSVGESGLQINVIPLRDFLPGGPRIAAILPIEDIVNPSS